MWLLLHDDEPIGIIIVSPPSLKSRNRNRVFGRSKWKPDTLNKHFASLARIVIDPRYRGIGLTSDFVTAACHQLPQRYIELVTSMGHVSHFWRKAGFVECGRAIGGGCGLYSTKVTTQSVAQSIMSDMRYYLLDKG